MATGDDSHQEGSRMKGSISISERSNVTWFPKTLIKQGFKGRVEFILNTATITLIHPNASLDDIETSLKMILKDIQLRRKLARENRAPMGVEEGSVSKEATP